MNDVRLDRIIEMFEILAENQYSALWEHIEDFDINGHHVSVKSSKQWQQVIIDNSYVAIGGNTNYMIPDETGKYVSMTPLEYARYRLSK